MKRLKLTCIGGKATQHNSKDDTTKKFNQALEDYCKNKKNEIVPYYKWFHTNEKYPPDINEDILLWNESSKLFGLFRSFSTLQNLIYRKEVMKIKEGTEFYWMRIKTPSGEPHYADNP